MTEILDAIAVVLPVLAGPVALTLLIDSMPRRRAGAGRR